MAILVNYPILKKVYMPREVMPLAYVISNVVHFLLAWCVFFVAFALVMPFISKGMPFRSDWAWFPVITLMELLLVTGMGLWAAALNVFYEDVKYMLQTAFQLLFFLLPVLYPSDNIYWIPIMQRHPWLFQLYMMNPITAIVNAYRKTMLEPVMPYGAESTHHYPLLMSSQWGSFAGAFALTLLIAWSGYAYFNWRKWQFVERP